MRDISSSESLAIPDGVTVVLKARSVSVEGPRGKLVKHVGHIQMDLQLVSRLAFASYMNNDEGKLNGKWVG